MIHGSAGLLATASPRAGRRGAAAGVRRHLLPELLAAIRGQLRRRELDCFCRTGGWVVLVKLAWFVGLRACRGWSRSVTFYDLLVLLQSGHRRPGDDGHDPVPLAAVAVDSPQRAACWTGARRSSCSAGPARCFAACARARWPLFSPGRQVRVLIAGAGDMGASTLRMIRRIGQPRYHVVGFIDRQPEPAGNAHRGRAGGRRLRRRPTSLSQRHRMRQVLVMQGELAGRNSRTLIDDARHGACEVRVLPNYRQLIEGSVTVQPRPVSIEDLLQRKPVQLDIEDIRQWIDGRVILVTGSAGSIGSEICRQLLQFAPQRIVLVDRAETGQFFLERELRPAGRRKTRSTSASPTCSTSRACAAC